MQTDMENFGFITELDYFLFYWLNICVQTGGSLGSRVPISATFMPLAAMCVFPPAVEGDPVAPILLISCHLASAAHQPFPY